MQGNVRLFYLLEDFTFSFPELRFFGLAPCMSEACWGYLDPRLERAAELSCLGQK